MKISITTLALFFFSVPGYAQFNIDDCHAKARANYPLINQYGLIEKSEHYSLENLAKNYLPQISLNAQATYQTDVTGIPIDFKSLGLPFEMEGQSKDQYKATLDVQQIIWDGGATKSQQKIAQASHTVEKEQVNTGLYAVEERITQLYFGVLAIDEQMKVLDLKEKDMLSNQKTVESKLRNEVAMQSDLDQINVELLNLAQNRTELEWAKRAYCRMLSLFIHEKVDENATFEKPDCRYSFDDAVSRPELSLYDAQLSLYDAQNRSIAAKNRPRLSLFAQGGYGRPGLNMLDNEFDFYATGGVRLSWNFGNLYTRKNERNLLNINKSGVTIQRETFLLNTRLQLTQDQTEIERYQALLQNDDAIIELRNRIKKAAESKYKNGVYQTNELIRDINAEEQARQAKALHEIQYLQSIHNYNHTQGNNE